jgi:predicted metal-dependent HD superfamily phosphohydrolase
VQAPETILVDLTSRYCEPHRVFHTLRRIADMLMNARDLALSDEQVLAIWYHDAIHDVRSRSNAADSAALAGEQLFHAGYPLASIRTVERIVLDTITHEASLEEARIVLDLDLATLGAPWDAFAASSALIRAEHPHQDDATYALERSQVFLELLERPHIFHTSWGERLEEQARSNLARAIQAGAR